MKGSVSITHSGNKQHADLRGTGLKGDVEDSI